MPPFGTGGSDLGCGIGFTVTLYSGSTVSPCSPRKRAQRRESALLLAPDGHQEVRGVVRLPLVQPGQGRRTRAPLEDRH
jgi:hypothetical protein